MSALQSVEERNRRLMQLAGDAQFFAYKSQWGKEDSKSTLPSSVERFSNNGVECCVWQDDETCVVGIAGTDDFIDGLRDLNLTTMDLRGLHVHAGFAEHATGVADLLKSVDVGERELVIAGHSLGGAAAALLPIVAPQWEKIILSQGRIYSFGSPRFLRQESAEGYRLGVHLYRIVRRLDLVPDVPIAGWLGIARYIARWKHVGRELYFTDDGVRINRTQSEWWIRRIERAVKIGIDWCIGKYGDGLVEAWHSAAVYRKCAQFQWED